MPYLLAQVELTQPLTPLRLMGDEEGVALLIRRNGSPVGFLSRDRRESGAGQLSVAEQSEWIARELKAKILEEALWDELLEKQTRRAERSASLHLSVAICTRGHAARLHRCLRAILQLREDENFEVLVVDSAPTDDETARVAASFPGVRYERENRPGISVARNCAWRAASGEVIAFISDRAVVDAGWFKGLQQAWIEYPEAAAVAGLVLPVALDTRAQILFEEQGGLRLGFDPIRLCPVAPGSSYHRRLASTFGIGCNMALRRDVLDKIGGFNEDADSATFSCGPGDHDIFYRLDRGGYTFVYEPTYLIFHEHCSSDAELRRYHLARGKGVMAFVKASYRRDATGHRRLAVFVLWWFREQLRGLRAALSGKQVLRISVVLAEVCGAIVELGGRVLRPPTPMAPARMTGPMTTQERWEVRQLKLDGTFPEISISPDSAGVYLTFWLEELPLGDAMLPAALFPLGTAEFRRRACRAIAPAVGQYLLENGFKAELPVPGENPARDEPPVLEELLKFRSPLAKLGQKSSAPLVHTSSVSVIVCTAGRPERLRQCLQAIKQLDPPAVEIIVVDNAPDNGETRAVATQEPGVTYLQEPARGLSRARNRGWHAASGEIIAFTDDDVLVHRNWVRTIQEVFLEKGISGMTGLVLAAELENESQFSFETKFGGFNRGYRPLTFDARFFRETESKGVPVWRAGAGANMAFRRRVIGEIGNFDERLGPGAIGGGDDSEFWYRMLAAGLLIRYEPRAVVSHFHRTTSAAFKYQMQQYMSGHVAALLVQFEKHGHFGNLRRLLVELPRYYWRRTSSHRSGAELTIVASELWGCLLGGLRYLRAFVRRSTPSVSSRDCGRAR